jgi:hypothetical protein
MEKQTIETNVVKPKLSIFVKEVEYRLINEETEKRLDQKVSEIGSFMASNHGFGQDEEHKDKLYGDSKNLWNQYADLFKDVKYTFYLNRKQYSFLTSLLRDKLEYDVNTVFLAIELTNMLGEWQQNGKYLKDDDIKGFTSDATEITYMYHLIAKHKVKGLTSDTYLFAEVLKKIGDISKIINYYDTHAKNLSTEIQQWVASFEPEVRPEGHIVEETAKIEKTSPKKSKKIEEING